MSRISKKCSHGATLKNIRFQKHDPMYANLSSPWIELINQRLMKNGKKKSAYRILQKSLDTIHMKTEQDALIIVEKAIRNTTPSVHIQTRRKGGSVHPFPVELSLERGTSRAIRWVLMAARKRSGKSFSIKLANELMDASKKAGNAFHKKEEVQKIAEARTRTRVFQKNKKK